MDSDEQPDTIWILDDNGRTTVGIATAAGGGSEIDYRSASPIPRSAMVANLEGGEPVVLIVSDGRGASLYAFADCRIQPVLNSRGETYEFDLQNLRGNGTGIGCVQQDNRMHLVGLQVTDRSESQVSWTRTQIDLDGLSATNGEQQSGTFELPRDSSKADLLYDITCGDRTMSEDGVTQSK